MGLVISNFDDHPGYLPQLARWAFEAWGRYNPSSSIRVTTEKARSMKYPKLYLLTFDKTLPNWYQKLGWQMIGVDKLNGYPVSLMEIAL